MVSRLMTAQEARSEYKDNGKARIRATNGSVLLKNTDGRLVEVDLNQLVYHRGNGNFGIYADLRDSHRKSKGYDPSSFTGKTGTGIQRHKSDNRKGGSTKKRQDRSIYS